MSSEKGRMFSHLKWKDRLKIEKMLKEKKSKSEIARTLRVDYTTVMREIKRGLTIQRDTNLVDREVYCAETAERKYRENLRAKGPDIKLGNDHELAQYIEGKIADDGYSPGAACIKSRRAAFVNNAHKSILDFSACNPRHFSVGSDSCFLLDRMEKSYYNKLIIRV